MTTMGWLLVLLAFLVLRGMSKGRSVTETYGDLAALFDAAIRGDGAAVKAVLARTGGTHSVADSGSGTSTGSGGSAAQNGSPRLVAFGHKVEALAPYYKVSENPAFGGVTPGVHVANSAHYSGHAIDINADSAPMGEKAALDRVNTMAKAAGFKTLWQVAGHFDHLHVQDI